MLLVVIGNQDFLEPSDEVVDCQNTIWQYRTEWCYDLRFPELSLMLRTKGQYI